MLFWYDEAVEFADVAWCESFLEERLFLVLVEPRGGGGLCCVGGVELLPEESVVVVVVVRGVMVD